MGLAASAGAEARAGRLAARILAHRWLWVALALLLALGAGWSASGLWLQPDARIFFAEDNPDRVALDAFEGQFARDDNVVIMLEPPGGDVFAPAVLALIGDITERAWQLPFVRRVISLTNIPHIEAAGDDIRVRDMVPDPAAASPEAAAAARAASLGRPDLVDKLVDPEGRYSAIHILLRVPRIRPQEEIPQLMAEVEALRAAVAAESPGLRMSISGSVAIDNAFATAGMADAKRLLGPMLGVLLLVIGLALRSVLAVFGVVLVIVLAALAGLGALGLWGRPLNSITVLAPLYIATLSVGSAVHIFAGVRQAMVESPDRRDWARLALARHMGPITIACVTTAVGFLTLNFSISPPFREFGTIVAIGVLAALALTLTLLPALVTLLPLRRHAEPATARALMEPLAERVIRGRRWLFPGLAGLALLAATGISQIRFEDDFLRYFDESFQIRRDIDHIEDRLVGLNMLEYPLESGRAGGINDPAFLAQAAGFVDWLRAQPEVRGVRSVTDTLKRLNMHLHGDDPALHRLPEDAEATAQALFLYELSLGYGMDLSDQINVSRSAIRVTASLPEITTAGIRDLEDRAARWLAANAPGIETRPTGVSHVFMLISQRDAREMLLGTGLAILLISGIIGLAFRNLRIGVLSLVPNLVPALVAFGIWGYATGAVTLAVSVVAASTLGIVVDDTVHFLAAYARGRRRGLAPEDAVRGAFRAVGMALAVTTAGLAAGFAVLAQSGFAVNGDMALLSGLTITVALLADFLMLPGLLIWLDRRREARHARVA
ncbi:MMPL family transporter [Paralimibaculum aggregatum]|uniref:MMPL family transporter n=1 Tax=Paralimibaculum aggregatum TaxID=3036245 RepID=A0ABQ6LL39_9RHOB|nr:MMPL family transporter [Limibaculum sp. NKW23]GMG83697.1 MMPL family transporter [Limibaculum sp. NKW23]